MNRLICVCVVAPAQPPKYQNETTVRKKKKIPLSRRRKATGSAAAQIYFVKKKIGNKHVICVPLKIGLAK
jgi:hypothetical protein